jgi:hypothetical protein
MNPLGFTLQMGNLPTLVNRYAQEFSPKGPIKYMTNVNWPMKIIGACGGI